MPEPEEDISQWVRDRQEMVENPAGRCYGCGLLAKHFAAQPGEGNTRPVHTVSSFERLTGRIQGLQFDKRNEYFGITLPGYGSGITCLADVDLDREVMDGAQGGAPDYDSIVLGILSKDRQCEKFVDFNRHRPPEWHLDAKRMNDLTQMQMDNAAKLSELERKQSRALARLDARLQKQTSKTAEVLLQIQKKNQADTKTSTNMFYLLGFITLVISIATLFFPDGLPGFKQEPLGTREYPSYVVQVTPTPKPTVMTGPEPRLTP